MVAKLFSLSIYLYQQVLLRVIEETVFGVTDLALVLDLVAPILTLMTTLILKTKNLQKRL